jgi:peptide/nickel transport system permease protein
MNMLKMIDSRFVKHASAMGVEDKTVQGYAFKNALAPVVTMIGLTYSYLFGGTVLVEVVFSWGGIGQYAVMAIQNSDYAPVQGFVVLAAVINLLVYLVVDIIYFIINPKMEI